MAYSAGEKRYERMIYRNCGDSGLKLPLLSLGLWHNFGTNDDYENMKRMCFCAFDRGMTHFDLANNYGPDPGAAETNLGRILREEMTQYRDELVISTKAGYYMWPGPYGDHGSRTFTGKRQQTESKTAGIFYQNKFNRHAAQHDGFTATKRWLDFFESR